MLWDGGGNHKGPAIRKFLARNERPRPERLPASSPGLDPVGAAWSRLKYGTLADLVPRGADHLDDRALDYLTQLKCDPGLPRQLWEGSGSPFPLPRVKQPGQPADQYQRPVAP